MKVRTKVTMQAIRWTGDNSDEIKEMLLVGAKKYGKIGIDFLFIDSKDQNSFLKIGDWLIIDEHGESWVCMSSWFDEHFEIISDYPAPISGGTVVSGISNILPHTTNTVEMKPVIKNYWLWFGGVVAALLLTSWILMEMP